MNRSMLVGVIGGVAVATAGGVAGYAFLGEPSPVDVQESAVVTDEATEPAVAQEEIQTTVQPSQVASVQPSQVASQAVASVQVSEPTPVVEEECWDEEVTVQVDPKDDNAIAGTAAGAVIGGVVADKISDDNDLATAAGAAAGAFFGRRAQLRRQENNTITTIERRCAPVGSR